MTNDTINERAVKPKSFSTNCRTNMCSRHPQSMRVHDDTKDMCFTHPIKLCSQEHTRALLYSSQEAC